MNIFHESLIDLGFVCLNEKVDFYRLKDQDLFISVVRIEESSKKRFVSTDTKFNKATQAIEIWKHDVSESNRELLFTIEELEEFIFDNNTSI